VDSSDEEFELLLVLAIRRREGEKEVKDE